MRDGFKGLYWRRLGAVRYFTTRRNGKRAAKGLFAIERFRRAGLTTGKAA